jgi:hypothetical protein
MAREADCGFMIWDGRSRGTLLNMQRLLESSKPVVVYFSPGGECTTMRRNDDLALLLARCSPSDRQRLSEMLAGGREEAAFVAAPERALANQGLERTARGRRR